MKKLIYTIVFCALGYWTYAAMPNPEMEKTLPSQHFTNTSNPSNGVFTVSARDRYPTDKVIVFDDYGTEYDVDVVRFYDRTQVNMKQLAAGSYFVKIVSNQFQMIYTIQLDK